jgi:hypothetical protein
MTVNRIFHINSTVVRGLLFVPVLALASSSLCFGCDAFGAQQVICSFTASPNPVVVTDGTGLGVTTLTFTSINEGTLWIFAGQPNGTLICVVAAQGNFNNGSCTTDQIVSDGMTFYLQNGFGPQTSLTIGVNSGGSGGCSQRACVNTCTSSYNSCTGSAGNSYSECISHNSDDLQSCLNSCQVGTGGYTYCTQSCNQYYNDKLASCAYAVSSENDDCSLIQASCDSDCNSCTGP